MLTRRGALQSVVYGGLGRAEGLLELLRRELGAARELDSALHLPAEGELRVYFLKLSGLK